MSHGTLCDLFAKTTSQGGDLRDSSSAGFFSDDSTEVTGR